MYAQNETFAPIRRKTPQLSYRDQMRACAQHDRKEAERERQQARDTDRRAKRSQCA